MAANARARAERPADLFITGTDTGIGKTFVAAQLLAAARRAGLDAAPMKPAQSGARRDGGRWISPDLDDVCRTAGFELPADRFREHCPYAYEPACSPHLAARLAGETIDPAVIRTALEALRERHAPILLEGAGGALVPLAPGLLTADLIAALKIPALVAARPSLGTLNHTLMTIEVLRSRGVPVAGVFFVHAEREQEAYIVEDNIETIRKAGGVRILGSAPHCAAWARGERRPMMERAMDGVVQTLWTERRETEPT
jgi:dethiobiotin synthase